VVDKSKIVVKPSTKEAEARAKAEAAIAEKPKEPEKGKPAPSKSPSQQKGNPPSDRGGKSPVGKREEAIPVPEPLPVIESPEADETGNEPDTPTESAESKAGVKFNCADCGTLLSPANASKAQLAKKAAGKCTNCVSKQTGKPTSPRGPSKK